MKISHCICHEVSFASIKALAEKEKTVDINVLQEKLPFALNCGMCLPYINRSLKTGETVFGELIIDDV